MSDQSRVGALTLSRRSAVRGAVWTLPAVTVATTAPAFAGTSGALTVTDLVVTYVPDRPEQVAVSATVTGFADSYQLSLTVPPGVFDSISDAASGSESTGVAASHTLVLTSTTADFHATLDLGSRTVKPWLGFQGPAFTVSAVARADGRESATTTAAVEAYRMPGAMLNGDVSPTASLSRLTSDSIAAHREYPGVIGAMAIVVAIPRVAGVAKPAVSKFHQEWIAVPEADETNHWLYRFETRQSHHTSRTGLFSNPDRGPAPDGGGYYEFWSEMTGMPTALVGGERPKKALFFYSIVGDTAARFSADADITA